MKLPIKDNCTYFYNSDIELMMASVAILTNDTENIPLFDEVEVKELKGKYYFLTDTVNLFAPRVFLGIFEFLANIDPDITIGEYKEKLLVFNNNEFFKTFLFLHEPVTATNCEEFYQNYKQHFKSFWGCSAFYNETKRLIIDFCCFAEELRREFNLATAHTQKDREAAAKLFEKNLACTDPLEYSQKLMGKIFRNRGPYKHFYFTHSLFAPNRKAIRYFDNNQVFFYPLYSSPIKEDDIINNLKTLADPTRFKILLLLKERKTMRGIDIAAGLGLTSPTISHHISELRNAGLLHEEQVKNTKYYSLNTGRLSEIINILDNILK